MSDEQEHLRDVHDEERKDSNSIPLWSANKDAEDVIPVHCALDLLVPDDCVVVGPKAPTWEVRTEPCPNGCCMHVCFVDTANDVSYLLRSYPSVYRLKEVGLLTDEALEQMATPPDDTVTWWKRKRQATLN